MPLPQIGSPYRFVTVLELIMTMRALLPALLLCVLPLPASAADKRFLAFGDSMTVGHGDGGVICPDNTSVGGYPPRLRSRLAARGIDAEFVNYGLCGERTDAGVSRIGGALNAGGDVIIIMEGTNDVSAGIGFETTLFNLNEMARRAEQADIEPLLASIVPRGPESGRDESNGKTFTIGNVLRADAARSGWAFADPFDAIFSRPSFFELYYFDQLHPNPTGYAIVAASMVDAAVDAATRNDPCSQVPAGPCSASDTVLCLNQSRFRLEATWESFSGDSGAGRAVPQTDDSGAFYWTDSQNIELVIKVLDGRAYNDYFWVFYGALSNFEFSLLVTDTETGECKAYVNHLGTFASIGDTTAFFDNQPLP